VKYRDGRAKLARQIDDHALDGGGAVTEIGR
jgi:hypothetical protein